MRRETFAAAQKGPSDAQLSDQLYNWIEKDDFPCVGAKSALRRDGLTVLVADALDSHGDDQAIHQELIRLGARYWADPHQFHSLAVLFPHQVPKDEAGFEGALWARINALTLIDIEAGFDPDPRVSEDPVDVHFSLSFGGEAFFVVGLHPHASRPARRFALPTLIFNPHEQFEQLRTKGLYGKVRDTIRDRDIALAGSINPMISDHGDASEAQQYSGRSVGKGWKCPYVRGNSH